MELRDKTALVTGAGGGIGRATAIALADRGALVIALDRDAGALDAVCTEIGAGCVGEVVDLADASALRELTARVLENTGGIDILVNNAGILTPDKLDSVTLEDWRALMSVNVDAALLLTQAVVPKMKQAGWGRIVNMASYAWKSGGLTAGTAYSVSKAALVGLTFSTARELAGTGITANAIAPAYVVSPMIMEQLSEADRARQLAAIPVGRFCEPEEVAHSVTFLTSPLAGFMTGLTIDMNGGMQFG